MDLEIKNSSNRAEIYVKGNIKSLSDNDNLKAAIINAWNDDLDKEVILHIEDSFIITSSVIGFLIKCIKKDKIPITVYVKNGELYEMLDDMSLTGTLNIRKAN